MANGSTLINAFFQGQLLGTAGGSSEPPMPGGGDLLLRSLQVRPPAAGRRAASPWMQSPSACSAPPIPTPLAPPTRLPPPLRAPQEAGVSGALVVQPGNHLYDHRYVSSVLCAHPGHLAGCLLADPTRGAAAGVQELRRLVLEQSYRAVRFNPYLWPGGRAIDDEVRRPARAHEW